MHGSGIAGNLPGNQDAHGYLAIAGIAPSQLAIVWPDAEPWLARACEHAQDGITTDQLRSWILRWEAQLWIVYEGKPLAAIVTRIVVYPEAKTLQITSAGGSRMRRWLSPVAAYLEGFARAKGCSRLEIIGRPAWARVLKKHGGKIAHITITKELR